ELEQRAQQAGELQEASSEELRAARRALLEECADPLVEEGLWLAGRELLAGIRRLREREPAAWGHKERHLGLKALAYVARFSTKTSPNGLFCATALAEFADGAAPVAGGCGLARLEVLWSIAEVRKVTACLAIDPAVDRAIVPRPNPTLREEDGAWTFWKPATLRHPEDDEVRSRVKRQEVVAAFLEEAARGSCNVPELIAAVGRRSGIEPGELEPFYRQLVDRGILIGEIEPPYNARRPLRELADACRRAACDPPWLAAIEEVEAAVDRAADQPGPARIAALERAGRALESLPHVRDLARDELVRLDAASDCRITLPRRVLDELRAGLAPYVRLFSAIYPEGIYRTALAARFAQFFPADTDVPLLDVYHGVFEPEDKRRPVEFPDPARVAVLGSGTTQAARALERLREHLGRRAREAAPGEELELSDAELREVVGDFPEPAWSCGVLFQLAAANAAAVARGDYRLVLSALFQGAGLSLARFSQLLGGAPDERNAVVRELRRGWSKLERPGAILAEITYNHSYRTANAGLRPSILRHEIELPGEKASAGAEVIPLRELTVCWDAAAGRFVLRWRATGDEVIPVITSGVNPVGVIQFLINIGQQGLQPLGYFPGVDVPGLSRWPRWVAGKLVVFRARWAFGAGEWPAPPHFLEVARWRRRHGIPRHVFVHTAEEPKPRYLDLDSPAFVELLGRVVSAGTAPTAKLHVTEMLPDPAGLWIADERGRYAAEFLVHLEDIGARGGRNG
ncbi:MAG TPA: lantibiotic dehydratase, partial [Candidatus Polarisedimenticolaceae bacterium]|nr:lantibiotic dehydratase [Candidatus Polarisedimenticolaceae bacterium]